MHIEVALRLVGEPDFRKNVRLTASPVLILGKKHAIGQLVADVLFSDIIQQLVSSPSTLSYSFLSVEGGSALFPVNFSYQIW